MVEKLENESGAHMLPRERDHLPCIWFSDKMTWKF